MIAPEERAQARRSLHRAANALRDDGNLDAFKPTMDKAISDLVALFGTLNDGVHLLTKDAEDLLELFDMGKINALQRFRACDNDTAND